ncbi:hypothetical protein PUN28_017996 [Cardiocondyla obscurior]|uniref:Uncharacterized protein n=1 Tax=Cardiocondyla obscurior TaxID=286306 RepID=A0AAW2EHM5_9HYME
MHTDFTLLDEAVGAVQADAIEKEIAAMRKVKSDTPPQRQKKLMEQVLENLKKINSWIIRLERRPNEMRDTRENLAPAL